LFFLGLLIWVFRVNKGYVQQMSHLPLKEDQPGANRFNL
jgi:cbb3-type cytochrome oxidase subunit 3